MNHISLRCLKIQLTKQSTTAKDTGRETNICGDHFFVVYSHRLSTWLYVRTNSSPHTLNEYKSSVARHHPEKNCSAFDLSFCAAGDRDNHYTNECSAMVMITTIDNRIIAGPLICFVFYIILRELSDGGVPRSNRRCCTSKPLDPNYCTFCVGAFLQSSVLPWKRMCLL